MNWGRASVQWNGVEYTLNLPHFIDAMPAEWLAQNVDDRLRAVSGCEDWLVIVTQAIPTTKPNSVGWDESGSILMSHIRQPFPNTDRLRHALGEAVEDAYQAAKEAEEEIRPFLQAIRGEAAQ